MRYWIYLASAIAAEVIGTCFLKWGADTSNWWGLAANFFFLALAFYLLALAVVRIPLGVAYATWEGIGILVISLVGIAVFGEQASLGKFLAMATIVAGILLLKRGTQDGSATRA